MEMSEADKKRMKEMQAEGLIDAPAGDVVDAEKRIEEAAGILDQRLEDAQKRNEEEGIVHEDAPGTLQELVDNKIDPGEAQVPEGIQEQALTDEGQEAAAGEPQNHQEHPKNEYRPPVGVEASGDSSTEERGVNPVAEQIETSFVLIKAHAVQVGCSDEIATFLSRNGFHIVSRMNFYMTPEMVTELFRHESPKRLGRLMGACRGFTGAIVLNGNKAYERLQELLGDSNPKAARAGTLRYMFGHDAVYNAIHTPSNPNAFDREIKLIELWYRLYFLATSQALDDSVRWVQEQLQILKIAHTQAKVDPGQQQAPTQNRIIVP